MGKLLSIDYGLRRTGLADTDELQIIASGLTTVLTKDIWEFLEKYLDKNKVDEIVVGDPGEDTNNTIPANEFTEELKKKFPEYKVVRQDERYSSVLAKQAMILGGMKKKKRRDKAMVDKISATIILQSYMNERG